MSNTVLYMEHNASVSTGTAGFTMKGGGRSSRNYFIGDDGVGDPTHVAITGPPDVWKAIQELIGTVHSVAGDPNLTRKLPLADPWFPWCFCEAIGGINGIGHASMVQQDAQGILEAPTVDYTLLYPCYKFSNVTFTPRPYALLRDEDIPTGTVDWIDKDGNDLGSFDYAQEWLRFTDVDTLPQGEYITAQAGQFVFDVGSGEAPDQIAAGPGQVKMLLKKDQIRMTWHYVPYGYIDHSDSYIRKLIGHVNQYDWWIYDKGTMLLEGVMINRYTPIVPSVLEWAGQGAVFANEKCCDITFIFSRFDPGLGLDGAGNEATPSAVPGPPNGPGPVQAVANGHNLIPWAQKDSCFYAHTLTPGIEGSNNRPCFPSGPFELLFSNPGVDS